LDIFYGHPLNFSGLGTRALGLDGEISTLVATVAIQTTIAHAQLDWPMLVGSDFS